MKKVYFFSSSPAETDVQTRTVKKHDTAEKSLEIETRKKLFRQPRSCPHFSFRIDYSEDDRSVDWTYRRKTGPQCTDLLELIESKVRKFKKNEFVYLSYVVPTKSVFFTPYCLKEVKYSEVDKSKYCTVSKYGVALWGNCQNSFTPLDEWIEEYKKYLSLIKKRIFSDYRLWKPFKIWRKTVKWRKFTSNRQFLSENLFFAIPHLATAVLEFRSKYLHVEELKLLDMCSSSVWELQDFFEKQMAASNKGEQTLQLFIQDVKEVLYSACVSAIRSRGFSPNDDSNPASRNIREHLSFADRVIKRRFCALISRYLRYMDYMTITLLNSITFKTFIDFLESIEEHYKFCPQQGFKNSETQTYRKSFLNVKIELSTNDISIAPTQTTTATVVNDLLERVQEITTKSAFRFESDPFFKCFTEPIIMGKTEGRLVGNPLDIEYNFCVDNKLVSNRSRLISLINDTFQRIEVYSERFDQYRDLFSVDLTTNPQDLTNLLEVTELGEYCARYTDQLKKLGGVEKFVDFGIFRLDQSCFEEIMCPIYKQLYGKLCRHIPKLITAQISTMDEQCQEVMGNLLTPPEGTSAYVRYLQYLVNCDTLLNELRIQVKSVGQMLDLVNNYQMTVEDNLSKKFSALGDFLRNCQEALVKKQNQKTVFISKLSECITEDVQKIYEEIHEVREEVLKDWILSEDSQPGLVKETISASIEQLHICHTSLTKLSANQEHFGLSLVDYTDYNDVLQEAKIRQNLWDNLVEWTNALQDWYTQQFHLLDIDIMTSVNANVLDHCEEFEKFLPDNSIAPKLKNSVLLFKSKLKIICYLRNPSLKMRHWLRIEEIIKHRVYEDESITIKDFEEVGIFQAEIAQQLTQISNQACAEKNLEEELFKMEKFWTAYHLKLIKYRHYRNNFTLIGIEEVETDLDDSFTTVSLIASSDYVEPIKDRVNEWIMKLNLCSETIKEWHQCQETYCKLEIVFTLPGIQFKMPEELTLFKSVNKSWRETMMEVHSNPHAISVLIKSGRLEEFKQSNKCLETVKNMMGDYLNSRRLFFPRLFFLSDNELIHLLTTQPKNAQIVESHLQNLFDSVAKLELTEMDLASLLEPLYKITSLISNEGVNLILTDGVEMRGSNDQWLRNVEIAMIGSVKQAINAEMKSYDEVEFFGWFKNALPQVGLTVTRLKLSQEIAEFKNRVLNITDLHIKLNHLSVKIELSSNYVRQNIQKKDYSKWNSLICTWIYYHNVIQNMIKSDMEEVDFHFLTLIRYSWVNGSLSFSILDQHLPYQYEFISQGEDFIFTPSSDRMMFNIIQSIASCQSNLIVGPAGQGKEATVKTLAKLVAKFLIILNCSEEQKSFNDFCRILSGLLQSRTWAIFDQFDRLEPNIIAVISHQMMLIRSAKLAGHKEIDLCGQIMKFNRNSEVFFISSNWTEKRLKIPDSFKIFVRPLTFEIPDDCQVSDVALVINSCRKDSRELMETAEPRNLSKLKLLLQQQTREDNQTEKIIILNYDISGEKYLQNNNLKTDFQDFIQENRMLVMVPNEEDFIKTCLEFVHKIETTNITKIEGPLESGKTTMWNTSLKVLNKKRSSKIQHKIFYGNSLSITDILGENDQLSNKFKSGLLIKTLNDCLNDLKTQFWLIFDCQVDSSWVHNLLEINEENSFLTFPNLDRIKISDNVKIIFETEKRNQKSFENFPHIPTFVLNQDNIDLRQFYQRVIYNELAEVDFNYLLDLFEQYFLKMLDSVNEFTENQLFEQDDYHKIKILVVLLKTFTIRNNQLWENCFIFCTLWSVSMNLKHEMKMEVEKCLRSLANPSLIPETSIWNCYPDKESGDWKKFSDMIPNCQFNPLLSVDHVLIPNLESVRMGHMIFELTKHNNILLIGPPGTGKSNLIRTVIKHNPYKNIKTKLLSWCAETSSKETQKIITNNLTRRRKTTLGPEIKSSIMFCIENFDSPKGNGTGTDSNVELLRQLIEINGIYDRDSWEFQTLVDVSFLGVCDKDTETIARIKRKCITLSMIDSKFEYFRTFFKPIIEETIKVCNPNLELILGSLVNYLVQFWEWMEKQINETKINFNDMKRLLIGTLRLSPIATFSQPSQLLRLFYHECCRTFIERIMSSESKKKVQEQLDKLCLEIFHESVNATEELIFGDFALKNQAKSDRAYSEIKDMEKLKIILSDYLEDYNISFGKKVKMFWHDEGMLQLARIAGMIRLPNFHGIVVGSPGIGKKTLSKMATFLNDYSLFEIRLSIDWKMVKFSVQKCIKFIVQNQKPAALVIWDVKNEEMIKEIHYIISQGWSEFLFNDEETNANFKAMENFPNIVRQNLHVLMLLNNDEEYQNLFKKYPSIQRHYSVLQLPKWSRKTLQCIAEEVFKTCLGNDNESLANLCVVASAVHASVAENAIKTQSEITVNPSKYLHLMSLYRKLFKTQKENLEETLKRTSGCLTKLTEIIKTVTTMQADLKKYLPALEERKFAIKEMKVKLEADIAFAEEIRSNVTTDEAVAKIQAAETQECADEAAKDLEIAMPALRAAQDTVKALSKSDMSEIKGLVTPSKLVMFVMEAVCILLKIKPDWPTARNLINEPGFIKKIIEFDKEYIPEAVSKKIKTYVEHKDFDPAKIEKISKVCKSLCLWVRAIDQFSNVYKVVEPKVKKQKNSENALREVMTLLRSKQQQLADAESKIQILKDTIEEKHTEYKVLQENVDLINLRLARANRLTTALADEEIKWAKSVKNLEKNLECLSGDILLTSASIAYLGEYPENVRIELTTNWITNCQNLGLTLDANLKISNILVEKLEIDRWHSIGLPKDEFSVENALIVTESLEWTLVMDPHDKFRPWIQEYEPRLKVIHYCDKDFEEMLEFSLNTGLPLLVEAVAPPVNQFLTDVLRKDIFTHQGKKMIKTTKKDVVFHSEFNIYLVTNQKQNSFPLDFLNNLNLVRFEVSTAGLKEIVLDAASKVELQILDAQTKDVQARIESDSLRMKELQDKIVQYLNEFTGNILDNEALVAAIYETKETCSLVIDRLADSRESENVMIAIREKYRSLAHVGTILFELVSKLKNIDPIYQFELGYFLKIFNTKIRKLGGENVAQSIVQREVKEMENDVIEHVFKEICASLRREDQLVFGRCINQLVNGSLDLTIEIQPDLKIVLSNISPGNPLLIIPIGDSLPKLLSEFESIFKPSGYYPISVGNGNEDFVIEVFQKGITEGKTVFVFNCSFGQKFSTFVEMKFVELLKGSLKNNFKLVLVTNSASEVPKSLLRSAYKLVYNSESNNFLENEEYVKEMMQRLML